MIREAEQLLEKALALPESERAELAGSLIASLDATVDPGAEAAWQQEIARRAEETRAGQATLVSWNDVKSKARTLLHGK
jgi:putative addiction module component (TIGR02574 family)